MSDAAPLNWRGYRRIAVWIAGAALAAICALNLTVDPFGAYRWIPLPALRGYRTKFDSRIGRAEILEHSRCEVVILGTSIAQIALDPASPLWGRPACNLAITGARISEIHAVLRHVLEKPEVREVILTLDFLSFKSGGSVHADFTRSRFNPALDPFEYHAGLLLGRDALRASLRVLRDYQNQRLSPHSELGLTDPGVQLSERHYRERFIRTLERDVAFLATPPAFAYSPEMAAETADLLARARQSGRAVTLLMLPSHALRLEALARFGQWDAFERWKSDLVAALASAGAPALWDCTGYSDPLTERIPAAADDVTQMRWHWDGCHIKRSLGDALIAETRAGTRPAAGDGPALCTRLDPASLPAALARTRSAQQRYRLTARTDLAVLDEARERAAVPPSTEQISAAPNPDDPPGADRQDFPSQGE